MFNLTAELVSIKTVSKLTNVFLGNYDYSYLIGFDANNLVFKDRSANNYIILEQTNSVVRLVLLTKLA